MRRRTVLVACGSFNPVTNMHLRMFDLARDHLQNGISPPVEVIGGLMSPVSDAYSKPGLVSAHHRCSMLNLALLTNDWVSQNIATVIHPSNVCRVAQMHCEDGIHVAVSLFFYKNLFRLKNITLHFIHHSGSLTPHVPLPLVLKIEQLVSQFGLVVVMRSGCDATRIIYESDILHRHRRNIHLVRDWAANEISSTGVRRALARGESVKYLLQDAVITYIHEHGLYRPPTDENQDDSDSGQETAV
ncbi:unnamed protein product [Ixodes hexagonus]